jgi:predicted membrane GTPase involved in stress response
MTNLEAAVSTAIKRNNGALIFRRLNKDHETDMRRTYAILHNIEEPEMELKFSKRLSVNGAISLLNLFIEDLRREGFNTTLAQIEVEPTEEEGAYKVPEGFSMPTN